MRSQPSILHLDLDAFFAAVEQRDKPSLRGRPVVVGGIGMRGVVSTASYEARAYGARSAMPTAEARRRCPAGTAFLHPRFEAYRTSSRVVMELLHEVSPVVEQVSVDEAYVDLAAPGHHDLSVAGVRALVSDLINEIEAVTGGLTASAGVASSKMLAKIGSDLEKPHGLVVVEPGRELDVLEPLSVRVLGGVGPATGDRLKQFGVATVADLQRMNLPDLVSILGESHGQGLYRLARAQDDREVVVEREAKSISAEETFEVDVPDRQRLEAELDTLVRKVSSRLASSAAFARTVTIKVRFHDFATHTRSATLAHATGETGVIAETAKRLLDGIDVSDGLRLLGTGVSGLTSHAQPQLDFVGAEAGQVITDSGGDQACYPGGDGWSDESEADPPRTDPDARRTDQDPLRTDADPLRTDPDALRGGQASLGADPAFSGTSRGPSLAGGRPPTAMPIWRTGQDVQHAEHGAGWVWGVGRQAVSVRFEGPRTGPGPVRTFGALDPDLRPADPPSWAPTPGTEVSG